MIAALAVFIGWSWVAIDGASSGLLYRGGLLAHSLACAVIISLVVALDRGWFVRGFALAAARLDRGAVVRAVPVALAGLHRPVARAHRPRRSGTARRSPRRVGRRSRTRRSGWWRIRSAGARRGRTADPAWRCSSASVVGAARPAVPAARSAGRDRRVRRRGDRRSPWRSRRPPANRRRRPKRRQTTRPPNDPADVAAAEAVDAVIAPDAGSIPTESGRRRSDLRRDDGRHRDDGRAADADHIGAVGG